MYLYMCVYIYIYIYTSLSLFFFLFSLHTERGQRQKEIQEASDKRGCEGRGVFTRVKEIPVGRTRSTYTKNFWCQELSIDILQVNNNIFICYIVIRWCIINKFSCVCAFESSACVVTLTLSLFNTLVALLAPSCSVRESESEKKRLSLSLSLSLSLTHTHTHMHTHIHTYTHTHIHAHTHAHTLTHIHTHVHTNTQIHKHIHLNTRSNPLTHTQHTQVYTHVHTHTHTNAHKHTRTQRHTPKHAHTHTTRGHAHGTHTFKHILARIHSLFFVSHSLMHTFNVVVAQNLAIFFFLI